MRHSLLCALLISALMPAHNAFASACIPEDWMYQTVNATLDKTVAQELSRLELIGVMATGLEGPEPQYYVGPFQVKGHFKGANLHFELIQSGKVVGQLDFKLPAQYKEFQNDLRWVMPQESKVNWSEASDSPVTLFKELRLQGSLQFSTEWQAKLKLKEDPKVSLTLFGHGNRCMAAEDYKLWRMEWNYQQGNDQELVIARGNVNIRD